MEPQPPSDDEPRSSDEDGAAPGATKFPVVGIGASAGGLEALEALTKRLSSDAMSFVVLQHLAPGHESALTDILARGTSMKVVTIEDGMRLDGDHIYVAPPSVDVALHQGVLRLMASPDRQRVRLGIDSFFRSLAADQGAKAIGVVLSGAGTDGTLGLKAIKEAGGITFAQEPSTASQPSMPYSALDAGYADFCLSPVEIGDELMRLASHPYIASVRPPKGFDEDVRSKLFVVLRNAFGVDFASYKPTTIERRIQRRMALHKLDRLEDYLKLVQTNHQELNALYRDVLIVVTGFFRDQEPFEILKSCVFPALFENRNPKLPIRIWVAGCATGEEAFSIAMSLVEHLGDQASNYKIQIFATDIDEQSLARARLSVYPQNTELDVSPERLQRFFSRSDKGYQVRRMIRDMVVFARHNLGKDPPFSRMDLVSCRNVLIYLQPQLQKKILRLFHHALNPNGFLLLGTSESVGDGSDLFSLVDRRTKLYSKKHVVTNAPFDFSIAPTIEVERNRARPIEYRPPVTVLQLADRKVLEQYGPPGVVVNETFDILQYRGKTGRFFDPTPGIASVNLLRLARPELLPELSAALKRSLAENARVISAPIRLTHGGDQIPVRLDVTPLVNPGSAGKTFVVSFDEQKPEGPPERTPPTEPLLPVDSRLQDLERELSTTKEYLQTTIENLQAANEELQSSNEELQSSNEELQSTNEELETSQEELQSTNEELVTLNEELHNRMALLDVTSDDLQNVLNATTSAVVIVGMDLRIRRFSNAAEKLLNLIAGDVGRPIAYIRTVVKARDIEQTVSNAINTITTTEQQVLSVEGDRYTMRIAPYRTSDHAIRGAVIELLRSGEGEKDEAPRELRGLGKEILAALPQALALLDHKLCIIWGNQAFLTLFQIGADAFGRPLEDLWGGRTEQLEVWKVLEEIAREEMPAGRSLTVRPFGALNRSLRFSARRLSKVHEHSAPTLVIAEEGADERGG